MLSVGAAELLAGGEVGGRPLVAAVAHEEERLLSPHVALYRTTDHRPRTRQVLEYLCKQRIYVGTYINNLLSAHQT